jgi:hypothetical protein
LLLLLPLWRLQRWLEFLRWRLSQLHWLHWQHLSLQSPLSSLWLPLPGLRLVLPQLPSVEPVLLPCSMQLLLLPVRFALRWLMQLPCWRLQQQLSLQRPSRLLCRLLWFRCSLLLWSLRWLQLLLQLPQCLLRQRWLVLFHWPLSQLRLLHWQPLSLQSLLWSLRLPLPELQLVLSPLL